MTCCLFCGAKTVEYTFSFNKGLARCLWLMRSQTQGVEIKTLNMTSSMWTNFQKLRYWDLIAPIAGENGRKGGYWKITALGLDFISGKVKINPKVTTYRNVVKLKFGDEILFSDVSDGYLYRADYQEQTGRVV